MSTIVSRAELHHRFEQPLLIVLAVAGGAIGVGVMSIRGFGPHSFTHHGEFGLWLFLIAAQMALWAVAAAILVTDEMRSPLAGLWAAGRRTVFWTVGVAAVPLLGFIFYATLRSTLSYPLPDHRWKILALSLGGAGVALLGLGELALVKFAIQHEPGKGTLADITRYLALRDLLQRILIIEGAILGAAILGSGALRNLVVAYHKSGSAYPREYVLLYGAYFTFLLALLYGPVYFRLLALGRANVDAACKAEDPASPTWLATHEKRKALEEYLQLQVATSSSFRAGIAILAPLTSALVGLLLGKA